MKIGDKIECINGVCGYKLGAIGIIKKIREDGDLYIDFAEHKDYGWANSKNYRLLKEEAMWDDKTVEAIKKSVVHWEENVQRLVKGEILDEDDYKGGTCSLCEKFAIPTSCSIGDCPLKLRKMKCGDDNTPWSIFNDKKTIENARNMVLALKSLFYPEEEKKEVFYSIGQRFINMSGSYKDDEYILCRHSSDVIQLTHIRNGGRWSNPVEVKNDKKVTESEFKELCTIGTFNLKESK